MISNLLPPPSSQKIYYKSVKRLPGIFILRQNPVALSSSGWYKVFTCQTNIFIIKIFFSNVNTPIFTNPGGIFLCIMQLCIQFCYRLQIFFTYFNTKMQIFHRKLLIAFPENLHFSLICKILQAAASFHLAVLHEICYLTSFFLLPCVRTSDMLAEYSSLRRSTLPGLHSRLL